LTAEAEKNSVLCGQNFLLDLKENLGYNYCVDKISRVSSRQLVKILLEGTKSIFSPDRVEKVGENVVNVLSLVLPLEKCCLWLVDEAGRDFSLIVSAGLGKNWVKKNKFLDLKKDVIKQVISTGKPEKVSKIDKENSYPGLAFAGEKIKSFYLLPLLKNTQTIGIIGLFWCKSYKIKQEEEKVLSVLGVQAAAALASIRAHERLKLGGNIDGLTGLYTHRYFQEALNNELARARRFKYPVCLMMIDIDHFKKYNDTFGHPAGDVVLKTIAEIIRHKLRSYDTVARYGGEEISVILPYTTREKAKPLAERIRREIASYHFKGTEDVKVTISLGLASYPDNAHTRQELIQRADQALYLAKEGGRNRVCFSLTSSRGLVRLAYCPPVLDTFYKFVLQGVKDVIADVGNVELAVRTPKKEEYNEQLKAFGKIQRKTVDAIALSSKTEGVMETVIRRANEKGISVFVFNLMKIPGITSYGKVVSFIGYDQMEAGRMVGEYLIKILRGKGEIAIIGGIPGQLDSFERREGFLDALSQRPEMKVVSARSADWQRSKARIVTRQILIEHPHLDAIFAVNDEMALGAEKESFCNWIGRNARCL